MLKISYDDPQEKDLKIEFIFKFYICALKNRMFQILIQRAIAEPLSYDGLTSLKDFDSRQNNMSKTDIIQHYLMQCFEN